ncbi:MAG TPA: hypothetical protein VEA69_01445 [Tepidisphaeraceae bacterium]|nr:hypothetical protein [Tepidisphaeraceae bacterium]
MAESVTDDRTPHGSDRQWAPWQARISASRKRRDERVQEWQENVDLRKGAVGRTADAYNRITVRPEGRISVNQDWPLTKAKIAQLYSQTPEIRLTPRDDQFRPAVPIFGRELNDVIAEAGVGSTIEEVLADIVNASGIGAVLVSCEKRTWPVEVTLVDPALLPPDQQAALAAGALELPTETVEDTADIRYLVSRISPADLLIPSDFTGSNYDQARWLGEDGRMTWAQAQIELGLTDDVKDKVLGSDKRTGGTTNSLNTDTTKFRDTDVVNYTQIFYWRHYYHADETSFKALQRIVFVDGLDEPVINEPYKGQDRTEDGRIVGVTRNPIRVCTLTYISDDSLPPSDSSVGRFQVDELEASRDAMVQQRKHSIPIRWFDSNRIGANTRAQLEKGNFQGFIPTNGPGDRAIGEVARASFPQEKFEFDRIIKNDLTEIWQVGTNQAGAFAAGERSAREAGIIERNFQRRVGQEQDKVSKFLLGIAEVLAGHLALYGTFDLPDELGEMRPLLATGFSYSVRVDSTVRLDAEQRIAQLDAFTNKWGQSGYLNPKPLIQEWAGLIGVDPEAVVIDPQPKPPEPVKVSVSTAMDLHDPLMLATLMRTQQAGTPDDLAAAIKVLQSLGLGLAPMAQPSAPDPNAPPAEVATPGIHNADWQEQPRINKRDQDGGA